MQKLAILAATFLACAAYAPGSRAETPPRGNLLAAPAAPSTRWQPLGSFEAVNRPIIAADAPKPEEGGTEGPGIVYFNTEAGYQTIDLAMLRADGFIPTTVESSGGGPFFGIGAGARLAFLTLGGRYRVGQWSGWNLSTLDGELGAHMTLGRFDPYFTFAAGYAAMHTTEGTTAGNAALDVHGFDGRVGLGVDYRPHRLLSIGVNFTGDVLALARPGIDLTASPEAQVQQVAARCNAIADPVGKQQCAVDALHNAEGTSTGFGGAFSLVMGLHF